MDFFLIVRGNDPRRVIQALLGIPRLKGTAIIAALPAALYEQAEQAAFRLYIADTLYYHGENKRLTKRFGDLLDDDRRTPPTMEEAREMAARLGITFTSEEE